MKKVDLEVKVQKKDKKDFASRMKAYGKLYQIIQK